MVQKKSGRLQISLNRLELVRKGGVLMCVIMCVCVVREEVSESRAVNK